jgi:hypothetical protein
MKVKFISSILFYLFTCGIIYAQTIPSFVDTSGLVAWYSFNGNANDISGKGNNGTILGGATFQNDRFGQTNQAILFDGVNDYVSIPRNSSIEPTNALTINAWITPTRMSNAGWRTLISKGITPGVDPFVSFSIQTTNTSPINNKWQFNLSNGNAGSLKSLLATKAMPDKDTLMITAVLGSGLMKLYVNGQLDTSIAFAGNVGYTSQNLLIGYNLNGANEYYKGSIDELGIWNKALTTDQIVKIYTNGGCTPKFSISASKPLYELNEKAVINAELLINRNYQWQTNPVNLGWVNISSNVSYSGAQTNVLSVEKIAASHHNLPVRLIAKNQFCNDTSIVKDLLVRYCLPDTFYVLGNANNDTLFISILSSISPVEKLVNRVKVYPNPANTELNFKLEQPGIYKAELTGITGSFTINTSGSSIDISTLPAGVYILRIFDTKDRLISSNKIAIIR